MTNCRHCGQAAIVADAYGPVCADCAEENGYESEEDKPTIATSADEGCPRCYDCQRPYGSAGFPDLVIPHDIWKQISPTGDEGGLLCPSCLIARLHISGIKCVGFLASGPIETVTREEFRRLAREREE